MVVLPECRIDSDCPSKLTCIRETCQNPCIVNNPCSQSQDCIVTDTVGALRVVSCVCPTGEFVNLAGECEKGIVI